MKEIDVSVIELLQRNGVKFIKSISVVCYGLFRNISNAARTDIFPNTKDYYTLTPQHFCAVIHVMQ